MRVLLVGSKIDVVELVRASIRLRWPDSAFTISHSAAEGLNLVETESPDLVVLQARLEDMDPGRVIKEIRLVSALPLVVLSEQPDELEIVTCLDSGADDYIRLPCGISELLARIWSLLRRCNYGSSSHAGPPLVSGALVVDPSAHRVFLQGQEVKVTPTEFRLLHLLISNPGMILTPTRLAQKFYGDDTLATPLVKKHIQRLRRKLEDDAQEPHWIASIRGVGYRFVGPGPTSVEATTQPTRISVMNC